MVNMTRTEANEYSEDEVEFVEVEIGESILLPSQTRNPTFGIWPCLYDEQSVTRKAVFNYRNVNRLRDSNDPELRKLYELFVMPSIIYSAAYHNTSTHTLLSKLNNSIRDGNFPNVNELVKIK